MTMPKKGSRSITVDGKSFRYIMKDVNGQLQVIIQESCDKPGRPISFAFNEGCYAVQPRDVSQTIKEAIKEGWDPGSRKTSTYRHKFSWKFKE